MRGPRCDAAPAGARRRLLGGPAAALLAAAVWAAACAGPDSVDGPPPPAAAEDADSVEASADVEDAEDAHSVEGPADVEDADSVEGPADVEDADSVEGPADVEDADSVEGPADVEDADSVEGPADVEDADSVEGSAGEAAESVGVGDVGGGSGVVVLGDLPPRPARPGAVVGVGEGPLRSERSDWESLMGEVLDVCGDDRDAAAAIKGRRPDPGEEVTALTEDLVAGLRRGCVDGRGFAHIGWDGPGPVRVTPEEAIEAVSGWACFFGCEHHLGYGASFRGVGHTQLGYDAPAGVFAVQEPVDEVVLLWDSVAVRDGALLGLVQNRSAVLFARSVRVAFDGRSGVFPLTVQPGEVAPFVLDGVAQLPERSQIEVSAVLSPEPDLSRSFEFDFRFQILHASYARDTPWLAGMLANSNFGGLELPLSGDEWVSYWRTGVYLVEPTSHPGAGTAAGQVIEDLRAYLTLLDDNNRVFAVHRLTPISPIKEDEPVTALPVIVDSGNRLYSFYLEFSWRSQYYYPQDARAVLQVGAARL